MVSREKVNTVGEGPRVLHGLTLYFTFGSAGSWVQPLRPQIVGRGSGMGGRTQGGREPPQGPGSDGWRGWSSSFLGVLPRSPALLSLLFASYFPPLWAPLVAQLVKNLPAVRRPGFNPWAGKIPWIRKGYSSFLAWRIPWTVWSPGVAKSQTRLSDLQFPFPSPLGFQNCTTGATSPRPPHRPSALHTAGTRQMPQGSCALSGPGPREVPASHKLPATADGWQRAGSGLPTFMQRTGQGQGGLACR